MSTLEELELEQALEQETPPIAPDITPLKFLRNFSSMHPGVWDKVEKLKSTRGTTSPDWPNWCFLPVEGCGVIAKSYPPVFPNVAHTIAALSAWRLSKSVYVFDEDVFSALLSTPFNGNIPVDILLRLPEWCVYIDMQQLRCHLKGFFAYNTFVAKCDHQPDTRYLCLLVLYQESFVCTEIRLDNADIESALNEQHYHSCRSQQTHIDQDIEMKKQVFATILPYLLYLCSDAPEIVDREHPEQKPSFPHPKKTLKGWRWFEAKKTRILNVGDATGEALRNAYQQTAPTGGRKSPHIRRAHWHGYWTGPRDGEREFKYNWLPPTIVAAHNNKKETST